MKANHSRHAAMSPTEVTEKLGLLRMKDRSWYCHPSNAIDGDGLFEGKRTIHLVLYEPPLKVCVPCRSQLAVTKHQGAEVKHAASRLQFIRQFRSMHLLMLNASISTPYKAAFVQFARCTLISETPFST